MTEDQTIAEAGEASGLEPPSTTSPWGWCGRPLCGPGGGTERISVTNVPNQIIPASVYMTPLTDDGGTALEQRFDYDVVNSSSCCDATLMDHQSHDTERRAPTGRLISAAMISCSD